MAFPKGERAKGMKGIVHKLEFSHHTNYDQKVVCNLAMVLFCVLQSFLTTPNFGMMICDGTECIRFFRLQIHFHCSVTITDLTLLVTKGYVVPRTTTCFDV